MESRKRARRGPAPSRVAPAPAVRHELPAHIASLIECGGQITIGAIRPVPCAAIATDEAGCLAMLKRRPEETLLQLLDRLDAAIDSAWRTERVIDEINPPPPKPKR